MKLSILLFCCFMAFASAYPGDKLLIGTWVLSDKKVVNYPEIVFSDKATTLFKSRGDTLYRYQYQLKSDNTIELVAINGEKYTGKIVKLNADSLIFEGLINQEGIQTYLRK